LNISYPEIQKACEFLNPNQLILDGEIVAFENNLTSFSKLQKRMHVSSAKKAKESGVKVYYYIFDILYLKNFDLCDLSLIDRKNILLKTINFSDPLRFTPHRVNNTKKYFKESCKKGREGLVVKKRNSVYEHSRSSDWQKFKCINVQEFVIGGYTLPQGSRINFGALLIGYYKNGKLRYAGKVGTGFSDEMLKTLGNKLKKNKTEKNPFNQVISEKNPRWVKPNLVCEVKFTEWTQDNKLRHPRFTGLRRDKSPKNVHKEK
jgi:DNA ligase D-like protein (predicted ligase)